MVLLNLFRKNDPFLNIILMVVLILLRVLYSFLGDLNGLAEIHYSSSYFLQNLSGDQFGPYFHIWTSGVFIGINTLLINNIMRLNQAFNENNYLAGLVYLVFVNSSETYFQLSGELIATTCLLLALILILSHVKQRASEENIFFTGVLIGLSVLFYSPMSIFLIFTLLVYVFYTRTIQRRYYLSGFGFCFPFIIVFSISLFTQRTFAIGDFFQGFFSTSILSHDWSSSIYLIFPTILMLYKLVTSFGGLKMTNHQIHIQRVMFLLILTTIYLLLVDVTGSGYLWLLSIPATYFISKSLLEIEKKWMRSSVFVLYLLLLIWPYLSTTNF